MKISVLLFLCCLIALSATSAFAETRYVTDLLIVTVRDNPSDNYQVLETLPTASPVEILEENQIFVKVRTEKGTEGYISKQYITATTPKKVIIASLQKQVDQLQRQLDSQKQKCTEQAEVAGGCQEQIEQLSKELATTRQNYQTLDSDFKNLQDRSQNVVELTTEHDRLAAENSALADELRVLQEENKGFHRSNMVQWFLAGGGVFFGGWLVGKISRKKRGFGRL